MTDRRAATRGPGPLDGVRVLDMSRVLAGPHCGRMLADLGADVIKVEPPDGDLTRRFPVRQGRLSLYFVQQNCGKRNVSIDLRRPEGVELVLQLAARCDVVLENFRPGVMDRMGIGYDAIRARHPAVVYATISGYGQDPRWAHRRAYAKIIESEAGTAAALVPPGEVLPHVDHYSHADIYTGLECVAGILAALFHRERTGEGQRVDVAMAATMLSVNERAQAELARSDDGARTADDVGPSPVPYFRTRDGRAVTMAVHPANPGTLELFAEVMGRPGLPMEPRFATTDERWRHREEAVAIVQEWVLTFDRVEDLEAALGTVRIALGVVRPMAEVAAGDWAEAYGAIAEVPDRAGGSARIPNSPWRFSASDVGVRGRPAFPGEDNRAVLDDLLGLDAVAVDALEEAGVIRSRVPDDVI